MEKDQNRFKTIEELLYSKRSDQPSPHFWQNFDSSWEKARGVALITPLHIRLKNACLHFLDNQWPRFSLAAATLLIMGLFLPINQRSYQNLGTQSTSMANIQGPCHFICDNISPNSQISTNISLSSPFEAGTQYTSNSVEMGSLLAHHSSSFLF